MRSILIVLLLSLAYQSAQGISLAMKPPAAKTEVVLLGTGTPYPDPKASGPATAVVSSQKWSVVSR